MKLYFDFTKIKGKIKPMHAVGQPPADICDTVTGATVGQSRRSS